MGALITVDSDRFRKCGLEVTLENESTFALAFAHAPTRWVGWSFEHKTVARTEGVRTP